MKTPDKICLIDTGDGIDWCDSVPSNDIPEEDVVWYTRTDPLAEKVIDAAIFIGKHVEAGNIPHFRGRGDLLVAVSQYQKAKGETL